MTTATPTGQDAKTHALCAFCFHEVYGTITPERAARPTWEQCCRCPNLTSSGIYVTGDAKAAGWLCGGDTRRHAKGAR